MPLYLGRGQIGICQRCGFKRKRSALVEDGRIANLLVCADTCYDAEHPQDYAPLQRPEGIPQLRPAPENLPGTAAAVLSGVQNLAQIDLDWTEAVSPSSLVNTYLVYRKVNAEEFVLLATVQVERDFLAELDEDSLAYEDAAVTAGNTYAYFVIGRPVQGPDSTESNTVTIVKT